MTPDDGRFTKIVGQFQAKSLGFQFAPAVVQKDSLFVYGAQY
jgi:hypothetical protein